MSINLDHLFLVLTMLFIPVKFKINNSNNDCIISKIENEILEDYLHVFERDRLYTEKLLILHYKRERDSLFLDCFQLDELSFISYIDNYWDDSFFDYCDWNGNNVVLIKSINNGNNHKSTSFIKSPLMNVLTGYVDTSKVLNQLYMVHIQENDKGFINRDFDTIIELKSYFSSIAQISLHIEVVRYYIEGDTISRKYLYLY